MLSPLISAAQTLALRDYTLANGLPQTMVYAICQDAQGRLWAGTQGGVCGFDGHQFRTLTTAQGLPDNHVKALAATSDGALWLGHNYGGVSVVRPDGQVCRCRPRGLGVPPAVQCVWPASARTIWVGTEANGLFRLNCSPTDTAVAHFGLGQGLPSAAVFYVASAAGPGHRTWVATGAGLVLLDAAGRPVPGLPVEVGQERTTHVQVVSDTLVWVATARGLVRLSGRGTSASLWRARRYGAAEGLCAVPTLRVVQDHAGNVWTTTAAGLSQLSAGARRFRCRASRSAIDSEENNDLLEDREGNIWFVHDQGLAVHPADERFLQYTKADGLPDDEVQAVLPLKGGRTWVGTRAGLVELTTQPADGSGASSRRLPLPPDADSRYVRCLYRDRHGNQWVGTENGAARYAPATGQWTYFNQTPGLAGQHVVSMAEDGRGRLWLATSGKGVAVFDPATNRFQLYTKDNGLPSNVFWQVFGDRAGNIWLASDDQGLVRADVAHDTFQRVAGQPAGLSVGSISEDAAGQLWLGTIGRGVLRYAPATGRFQAFGPEVGLKSSNPYFVQCDSTGGVWVGTNRGLDYFDPRQGQTRSYGVAEGFLGQEANQNAVRLGRAGQLWVGTVGGVMHYDPARARPNRMPPLVHLTGLRLFLRDTAGAPGLRLPARLNHLTFDYVGTSLTRPDKVRYEYRLRGFEEEWAGPLTATSATYTNLEPGSYTFEVRAANEDGVWSARPAEFALTIRPPWWRTWWAYALYLGSFGLVIYGVRAYTRTRERDRAERRLEQQALTHLQELDRVKTDFFTNVSHELRTPLTLIMGPAEELATEATDPVVRQQGGLMLRNARKLLALINQLLDLSKLEAGALRLLPTAGDAGAAARQVVAAFASLADSRRILLRCTVPAAPIPLVFDAGKLDEVLTNLIANALRFTPAGGFVTVSVVEAPPGADAPAGSVVLTVRDTGAGIAAEELPHLFDRFYQANSAAGAAQRTGTGIGLALVRELVALHGGTVSVASQPGVGSTFTVRLPQGLRPISAELAAADPDPAASLARYALAGSALVPVGPAPVTDARAEAPEADVVLIIEDNDDVREFIRTTLAPAGYRLLLATDGLAGVAMALAEVPDLVVSDVMMPGLTGHEVCTRLKADPATSHVPVVLLTARSGAETKLEGLETGADALLAKPFNPRELRAQVRNLLALRQRLHAHLLQTHEPPETGETLLPVANEAAVPAPEKHTVPSAMPPDPQAAHAAAVAGLPSLDQEFLRRIEEAVLGHLGDEAFGVDELGSAIGMSRTQVHRKLKALTGQSPGEHIRNTRLHRARALLRAQVGTVAEVAYQVGFGSPAAFSTAFSRQFGYPPSVAFQQRPAPGPSETAAQPLP
ncbi:hybrid sensor histidine kinase/response regulator transcription factor [Hymenobacter glaciei]|uniref:histidine kinase n=1 Tax=Hymenobacter glaciei TaxID=877209 RepID=A0ABP7TGT8_9BACT